MDPKKNFQKKIKTDKVLQLLAGFNNFANRKNEFSDNFLTEQKISKENKCIREFNFLYSEKTEIFYKKIIEKVVKIIEVKKAFIVLLEEEKKELLLEEIYGFSKQVQRGIKNYQDSSEIKRFSKMIFDCDNFIYSYICLNDKIIGLIGLSEKNNAEEFDIDDFNYLSLCCGQIAYSVENHNLIRKLHLKAYSEKIVNNITSCVRSSLNIEEVLANGVKSIKETFNIEKCSVIKFCDNNSKFLISDIDRMNFKIFSIPVDYSLELSNVYQKLLSFKSAIVINNELEEGIISQEIFLNCLFSDLGYSNNLLIVPLIEENNLTGIILGSEINGDIEWKNEDKILIEKIASVLSTAIHQAEVVEGIKKLASKDELTGLINRRCFVESFTSEVERVKRNGQCLSFALLDIDCFKLFNDKWGHLAGDYVLSQIGDLIKENIRKSDIAARYGGEEFALILPDTSVDKAYDLLDRLRTTISMSAFDYEGATLSISISAGVMELNDFASSDTKEFIMKSIKMADSLLYKAKDLGRNNVCIA